MMNNIIVTSGKEVVLNHGIARKVYTSEAVEVAAETDKTKANNRPGKIKRSRNFQAEETGRYAGSRGDSSKMVANYAGVSSGNDARNDISCAQIHRSVFMATGIGIFQTKSFARATGIGRTIYWVT